MPAAVAEKLDTDPRSALRAAITAAWKAVSSMTKAQDDLKRGEDLVIDLEAEIAKTLAALEAATAEDGAEAAKAIARHENLGAATARHKVERQLDEITEHKALAEGALPELRKQLRDTKLAADIARSRLCTERNALVAPIAIAIQERRKVRRLEELKDRASLAAIVSDVGAPTFSNDVGSFFAARNAEIARKKPFSTLLDEVADFADFRMTASAQTMEEVDAVAAVHAKAMEQLAVLLEDADAEFPVGEA
jgi:hypothetical protein